MVRSQFSALEDLSHDMERVFDSLLGRTVGNVLRGGNDERFAPPLDVHDTDDAYVVQIDLPGVQPSDVNLEVLEGALVISGSRKLDCDSPNLESVRCERSAGEFRRTVTLPGQINVEAIDASYALGVLTVKIPKQKPKRPTKIQIRTDG